MKAGGLVALFALSFSANAQNMDDFASNLKDAQAACKADIQDERLNVLRNKIRLFDEDITSQMLGLERKPTSAEVSALRLLYDAQVRCAVRFSQLENTNKPSPLWLGDHVHQTLSALTLLIRGHVTYADYARWLSAHNEAEVRSLREALEKEQSQQNTLILSCLVENPTDYRGIEFQYRVDQRNKSVYASRGPGAPSNVSISESEIRFTQQDSAVSISRVTGVFSITAGGAVVSGRCSRATSRAF